MCHAGTKSARPSIAPLSEPQWGLPLTDPPHPYSLDQWCARVIFSCQSRARVTSPSSQSHLKFFRVELESSHKKGRVTWSHWFTSSSQCRVIQNFKLFPYVCGYRSTNGRSVAIGSPVDFQGVADIKSTTSKIKKIGFTTSTEKTKKYWWTSKQAKQQEANMNYILNMNRTSLCSHSNHVLITLLFSLPVTT